VILLGDDDPVWHLVAEDAVLGLEVLDHAGELGIGGGSKEGKVWV